MTLAGWVRARRLASSIAEERRFYAGEWTPAAINDWQLERLNDVWGDVCRRVPFYERLRRERSAPERFSSWAEFGATVPILDRATVQAQLPALLDATRPPDFWRSTGGSTAEPLRVPGWRTEIAVATRGLWFARGWWGVTPADRAFLIWGHSHLLGQGVSGWLNARVRRAKDRLLGYRRYSAYDLSESGLRRAAAVLLDVAPAYVVGYAVALDRFARVNRDRESAFRRLGLKVAIATAESFPVPDSASLVAGVLGCPVAMEYGAVESGVIAHQRPDGGYGVLWRHHAVEAAVSAVVPGAREVLVTSLYPRCLPLLRYRLGDLVAIDGRGDGPQPALAAVIGRCNDTIGLPDGAVVHSEAFSHALRDVPGMLGFQVVQSLDGAIRIDYVAPRALDETEIGPLRGRLRRIHPALERVRIARVAALEPTVAGKTRRMRREALEGQNAAAGGVAGSEEAWEETQNGR